MDSPSSRSDNVQDDFFGEEEVSNPETNDSEHRGEVYQLFDEIYKTWNNNPVLGQGETFVFDLLTPDQHLVRRAFKTFKAYVKRHPGWCLNRREATVEERKMYRIRRKSKVYFLQVVYTVPLEGAAGVESVISSGTEAQYDVEPSFAKSSNSAFSPARPTGGRLFDSTNATSSKRSPKQNAKKSRSSRIAEAPTSMPQQLDPNRSFVPLLRTPARKNMSSPPLRRPLALSAAMSPLSPHMPPQLATPSISETVLQAAPQQVFTGGFVYGDIVCIENNAQSGSSRRGMVVGQAASSENRLIVSINMERLEVGVQELKLVKGMPRWGKAVASLPLPDGRTHLPK